jgi:uncharacterized SAM-binding protein YcdF (DUF218 family)
MRDHARIPRMSNLLPVPGHRRVGSWTLLLSFLLIATVLIFRNVGRWLVIEDPLQKADAIAVLSGRVPGRALEAARVYKEGYSSRVWLTHSTEPGAALAKLSVPYLGEDSYDKQVLIHQGVPENAIAVLDPPAVNTADEMETIGQALEKEKLRSVILVTSKVHTRRVKALWKRISGQRGAAMIHGDSDDPFDPAHWWRHTRDALDVVQELLGLANAWAGLPLKPAT